MAKKNAIGNDIIDLGTVLGQLSEAQAEKVQAIQQSGGKVEISKCVHCGKYLVRDASIEAEEGDRCAELYDTLGYTKEGLLEHRMSMTQSVVPDGYIKVAALHKLLVKEGIPVSRMVNLMGKDRSINGALDPRFQPVYVGNARWLPGWCASKEGLAFMANYKVGGAKAPGAIKINKSDGIADTMEKLFSQGVENPE